jgi:arsenate reductase
MLFLCYPKCTTCQRAKQWLDEKDIPYTLRDIKQDYPTADELRAWHEISGLPIKKFFNTSGLLYKSMQLKGRLPSMSEEEQIALLASDGMLVKRPILACADLVLVGFCEAEWESAVAGHEKCHEKS